MKEIKIHNISNLPTKSYKDFKELQEDFKEENPELNEKLQNRIIEVGFKYPVFCWKEKEIFWTIDSHQRSKALAALEEKGYKIPKIPYLEIFAKSKEDAKKEILYLNSRYAKINPDSNFVIENFKIDVDFAIEIPEISLNKPFEIPNFDSEEKKEKDIIKCPKCGFEWEN